MVENESTPFCLNEFLCTAGRARVNTIRRERNSKTTSSPGGKDMKRGKIKNWPPDHQDPAHHHQHHDQHFQDRHQVSNLLTTSMIIDINTLVSTTYTRSSTPWPPPCRSRREGKLRDKLLKWKMRHGWKQNGEFSWYLTIIKLQNDIWPSLNLKTSHYKCCSANLSVRLLSLWVGWIKTWTKFGTLFSKFCWIIQKCALVD